MERKMDTAGTLWTETPTLSKRREASIDVAMLHCAETESRMIELQTVTIRVALLSPSRPMLSQSGPGSLPRLARTPPCQRKPSAVRATVIKDVPTPRMKIPVFERAVQCECLLFGTPSSQTPSGVAQDWRGNSCSAALCLVRDFAVSTLRLVILIWSVDACSPSALCLSGDGAPILATERWS